MRREPNQLDFMVKPKAQKNALSKSGLLLRIQDLHKRKDKCYKRITELTICLTNQKGSRFQMSYHPPLFFALKTT